MINLDPLARKKHGPGEEHEAFSVAKYLSITCTVVPVSEPVNPT